MPEYVADCRSVCCCCCDTRRIKRKERAKTKTDLAKVLDDEKSAALEARSALTQPLLGFIE